MAVFVKICGVTSVEDAARAVDLGADAIGVNLVPSSKRFVDGEQARRIVQRVAGAALSVAVVADEPVERLAALKNELEVDRLQLHGRETAADVQALLPAAFKAVPIGDEHDVQAARGFPGDWLLVDARVEGALGGTGRTFDWRLVSELAHERRVLLAGGLTADNVGRAVRLVRPWGVDVASGVEVAGDPRRKDPERMRRFIEAARSAERDE